MISVIIPAYNRRELLLRAVESVLGQTYADLECIVVDDASEDGTQAAVLAIADERLRYVRQARRSGACAARNRGVDMARGAYVAFQDSDDVWYADKLATQLALLEKTGADVVCCAMNRVAPDGSREVFPNIAVDEPLRREDLLLENLCSTQCIMGRAEVFREVRFDEELPRLQDWDLMLRVTQRYRVHIGQRPLVDVHVQPDSISQKPRSLLAAYRRLYARYHRDFVGRDALIVHQERVDMRWIRAMVQAAEDCGEELWTQEMLDTAPEWVCRMEDAARFPSWCVLAGPCPLEQRYMPGTLVLYMSLRYFAPSPGSRYLPMPLLREVLKRREGLRFAGVYAKGKNVLTDAAAELTAAFGERKAWELLAECFGGMRAAAELASSQMLQMGRWAGALAGLEQPVRGGRVKRIGVYYHRLWGGGVQRAAAALIRLWCEMGYEVMVITSQEAHPEDYPIPAEAMRRVIPAFSPTDGEQRRQHVQELVRWSKNCDVLVYHAWADPMILWDLLAVRSMGTRFIVHTHSVFTMPLMEKGVEDRFWSLPDIYALADGVVTLSEADRCYWGQVNARVYQTVHPLTYPVNETTVNPLSGRTILWSGRMTAEKRPMDAVSIMREVVKAVPGARMIMLGTGNEETMKTLRSFVAANGLTEQISLPGFQQEPEAWLRQADVFLCTSMYEGFGLSLAEAATFGIPAVCYDMPYLTTLQGGWHIPVAQGDTDAAAAAVIRLLRNGEMRQTLGRNARVHAETRLSADQRGFWQRVFDDQTRVLPPMVLTNAQAVMLSTLREHVLLSRKAAAAGDTRTYQTAFVPMPVKGPARRLRKKAATFLQVLLIEGIPGVKRVLREKKENRPGQ